MKGRTKGICAVCAASVALAAAPAAQAIELGDRVDLHGFGNQDYITSTHNNYLGSDKGTWDSNDFGAVLAVTLDSRTKFWTQLEANSDRAHIDWAFIDFQWTNDLSLRAGQVKLPLGLSNEDIDVQFIRAGVLRPMMYQGAAEFTDESFRGASARYSRSFGAGGFTLDGYAGQLVDDNTSQDEGRKRDRLLGGRLIYAAPIDGLRFMASAYKSKERAADGSNADKKLGIVSAEYVKDALDLKAEYGRSDRAGEKSTTYYAQAAYSVGAWKPFVRYEYLNDDDDQKSDPKHYQKSTVAGIGYRFANGVGLRIENHFNRGYALPAANDDVTRKDARNNWNLLAASISFAF